MIVNRAPVKIVEAPQMAMRHVSQPIRHLRRHIPFANSPPSRIITCVASSKGFGSPEKALKPKQGREFVMPTLPCNCGSGKGYKNCCEPVHTGVKKASSPEATLRSRFSAYTLGLEEFIADSTHPDCECRLQSADLQIADMCATHTPNATRYYTTSILFTPFEPELTGKVCMCHVLQICRLLMTGKPPKRPRRNTPKISTLDARCLTIKVLLSYITVLYLFYLRHLDRSSLS